MSARDELIGKARTWAQNFDRSKGAERLNSAYYIKALADELAAAAPRTITTPEDLDALPEGTLIRAVNEHTQHMGAVLEKHGSSRPRWLELDPSDRNDGEDTVESGYVLRWRGSHSVTVIYEPGPGL